MKVNNLNDWARESKYIVVRIVDGAAWFYDALEDFDRAAKQAIEVGGLVVMRCDVEEA